MQPAQPPPASAEVDDEDGGTPQAQPQPDGPGPRDVPDSQVIDKTLPQKPPADDRPA